MALIGTARGIYTFGAHMKWTWPIGLGYAAGIICHLMINAKYFHKQTLQRKRGPECPGRVFCYEKNNQYR